MGNGSGAGLGYPPKKWELSPQCCLLWERAHRTNDSDSTRQSASRCPPVPSDSDSDSTGQRQRQRRTSASRLVIAVCGCIRVKAYALTDWRSIYVKYTLHHLSTTYPQLIHNQHTNISTTTTHDTWTHFTTPYDSAWQHTHEQYTTMNIHIWNIFTVTARQQQRNGLYIRLHTSIPYHLDTWQPENGVEWQSEKPIYC